MKKYRKKPVQERRRNWIPYVIIIVLILLLIISMILSTAQPHINKH